MTAQEAEEHLLGLELFGMRFGLERMRALLDELGRPQERFRAVHVVGSNGKSSTTRFCAAILRASGLRVGACTSPHLVSFAERVQVDGIDLEPEAFAAAVTRAAEAAAVVEAGREPDDHVSQFELLMAASLWALAQAGVEAAVIEAGLGGRYDATNVLPDGGVSLLTPVTLEHTRWLGDTITAIAGEKADVIRPGGTLVLHAGVDAEAAGVATAVAADRGARVVRAGDGSGPPVRALAARGAFQPANFEAARVAAGALLGHDPDEAAVALAAATTVVPGRFELLDEDATGARLVRDGAHNPAGCVALAATLETEGEGRRVAVALGVLEDKDARAMAAALAPQVDAWVLVEVEGSRAMALPELRAAVLAAGVDEAAVAEAPDATAAVAAARRAAGPGGLAVVTGSLHLLSDLARIGTGHAASAF